MKNKGNSSKSSDLEKLSILFRFAELGKLSSGLIHDLINPLCAMSLYLDDLVMKSNYRIPLAFRKKIETVSYASKKMEAFVIAIRKKLSQETDKKTFSVKNEINHTIELLSKRLCIDKVNIVQKIEHDVYLYGNPLCFYQIILNLVSNAIDAYKHSLSAHKVIHLTCSKQNNYLNLTVTDHGCGISDEIIQHIFEPFFTTKDSTTGTGIGLCSTKNIIENDFEGTISVVSTKDKGTVFTVSIPLTNHIN